MRPRRRLILRCEICDPDGLLIEPTSDRVITAAMNHALDQHLDALTLCGAEHVLSEMFVHPEGHAGRLAIPVPADLTGTPH